MSTITSGVVNNGVIVPASPLPEGTQVDVVVKLAPLTVPTPEKYLTATELLKLPREQREAYLAAGAADAEELYRTNKDLMGWDAFSEELDDDTEAG